MLSLSLVAALRGWPARLIPFFTTLAMLMLGGAASAVPIVDQENLGSFGNYFQIQYFETAGQEFVPTLPGLVAIRVGLSDANNHLAAGPITLRLHATDDTGPILATAVVSPFDGVFTQGLVEFVFPETVAVTPFETYFFELDATTARGGMSRTSGNAYTQGRMMQGGNFSTISDAIFQTVGDTVLAPEPSTALLLGLGLALMALRRRSA